MRTYSLSELKVGMKVVFVDDSLNTHASVYVDRPEENNARALFGMRGIVVALSKGPGKVVGICFEKALPGGHSCDMAAVPHGHGFWVLPEHLYSEEAHAEHLKRSAQADSEQAGIRDLVKGFLGK